MTVTKNSSTLTIADSERMLSTLLSNLPGMAYCCRNDDLWTMQFVSAGCFELTGYEPEDLIENKRVRYSDLIDEEDRQRARTVIQAALLQRQSFRLTYRITTATGTTKWVWEQGVGIFSPDGSIEAIEGFITDITHRKLAEKQVRDSEIRFRRIFEYSSFGIAMCSDDFRFTTTNDAFCRMTGYSEQELMLRTFCDITHPDDLATSTELVTKLLNKEISNYRLEKRYIRKNGTILWASITVSAIHDEKDSFLYFLGMIEDITERKKAETELVRLNEEFKKHDKLKDEFVSTVSHELRTPLCVFKNIISNAMAGVNGPINPKLRENLNIANYNIDRLARIVNDFLDIARMEAGKVQLIVIQVKICTVIREVIEAFTSIATPKNITIDTIMPDTNTIVEGDRDKITQILTNLIGNAVKHIRPGDHILVTLDDHNDEVSISIHDNGPGIEPKYLNKIFDRFMLGATSTRSGQPSTGLGLTISKELVELHHGHIWVESIVEQGSTFTFTLPKKQPAKN